MARNKALVPRGLEKHVEVINTVARKFLKAKGKDLLKSLVIVDIWKAIEREKPGLVHAEVNKIGRVVGEIINGKRLFIRLAAKTRPKTSYKKSGAKIVLADGKKYDLLRFNGADKRVGELMYSGGEYNCMEWWFMRESHAGSSYLNDYIYGKNSEVYFVMDKKNEPIAFFALTRFEGRIDLGAIFVKEAYRLPKHLERVKDRPKVKGNGQRLTEYAIRVARKSGATATMIPEMTWNMIHIADKIEGKGTVKQIVKGYKYYESEAGSGPDWVVNFRKRKTRHERRKTSQSRQFRQAMNAKRQLRRRKA